MIRILGIDPGSLVLGWALVDADLHARSISLRSVGVIIPRRGTTLLERLAEIARSLDPLLCEQRPAIRVLALEHVGFVGHGPGAARASLALGLVRGVVISAAARAEVELRELAISTIKRAAAGRGNATKAEVASSLRNRFGRLLLAEDILDDVSDAAAVAVAAATGEIEAASI